MLFNFFDQVGGDMWFMALPITGFAIAGKSIEELFIRLLTLIQGHKLQLSPFFSAERLLDHLMAPRTPDNWPS